MKLLPSGGYTVTLQRSSTVAKSTVRSFRHIKKTNLLCTRQTVYIHNETSLLHAQFHVKVVSLCKETEVNTLNC